jgi:Peptidase family S51/Clp amino terminal domain, pathogenicity island component
VDDVRETCRVHTGTTDETVDFLTRLRVLAGREAAELGHSVVDVEHLLLAATRDELGCAEALGSIGVDRRQLRDFVMFIGGVNEALLASARSRPHGRTRKREPADALPPVTAWAPEATDIVERAASEAARDGRPFGPPHLLIGGAAPLLGFGLPTVNEMRRALGVTVPVAPERVAHRLPVPRRAGALVLGGGGDKVSAAVGARLATTRPSIVYIGAAYPLRRGLGAWTDDWTAGGDRVTDSGLYTRDDSHSDEVCRAISAADVILIGGGRPGVLYDSLAGTPALEALVAASDHGAVVVGTSGSAHIMGSAAVNPYGDDGVETEPTLAWLDVVVSTHHRDSAEEITNLRRWLWPAITTGVVLLVPEGGAIWVHPGWRDFEQLDPGTHGTGAKWWTSAAAAPVPLGCQRERVPGSAAKTT